LSAKGEKKELTSARKTNINQTIQRLSATESASMTEKESIKGGEAEFDR